MEILPFPLTEKQKDLRERIRMVMAVHKRSEAETASLLGMTKEQFGKFIRPKTYKDFEEAEDRVRQGAVNYFKKHMKVV